MSQYLQHVPRIRKAAHVARMGDMRRAYRILDGIPERGPVGRRRRRFEDNIKLDHEEMRFEVVLHLRQDSDQWWALVNTVVSRKVAQNTGNFLAI